MSTTPGSKLQTAVLKMLLEAGIFAWRQNNQPTWDPKMNSGYGAYRSHGGLKGVSDILACVNSVFVAIEIKAGADKISADQLFFRKRLERSGGTYFIIRSLDDAKKMITSLSLQAPAQSQ